MASSFTFCSHCGVANLPGMHRCFACSTSLVEGKCRGDPGGRPGHSLLLNRYRLVSQVGTGGFVAVKEINLHGLSPTEMIEATDTFNREVQLLTALSHPHLPHMYDHATDRQAIINAMKHISYAGITGHYSFDANGDVIDKFVSVYRLAQVDSNASWKVIAEVKM